MIQPETVTREIRRARRDARRNPQARNRIRFLRRLRDRLLINSLEVVTDA